MFRSLLRFSIRDVLWLTLFVALVFGYCRQIRRDAEYADGWRNCAESLGELLADEGWIVEWDTKRVGVKAVWDEKNAKPRPEFTAMGTGGTIFPTP